MEIVDSKMIIDGAGFINFSHLVKITPEIITGVNINVSFVHRQQRHKRIKVNSVFALNGENRMKLSKNFGRLHKEWVIVNKVGTPPGSKSPVAW